MIWRIRLTEYDRGGLIAAPTAGLGMFFVDGIKDRERTHHNRYNVPGCRDFVEAIPEEEGIALFSVQRGDLLGESYMMYWLGDGDGAWQQAPWERPWWPRLAKDPRPIFLVHPPWEIYVDMRVDGCRTPPPMPPEGVELVDHYNAEERRKP